MGIDYGYALYLPTHAVGRALRAAAAIARPGIGPVDVTVPGGERITLPFRGKPTGDVDHWELDSLLYFPVGDEAIRRWAERERTAGSQEHPDALGRIWIGSIYLSFWRNHGLRPGYSQLKFTAATTGMSRLFEQSPSIRDVFVELAESAGAVCLVLDREGDGDEVCWPVAGGDLAALAAGWPEIE
ncbi:hypothetical protein Q0Z83_037280 [Actinoplanes sichuanensis]|uniref:Uncharacterized protein n=1 Tax=Actinoplanes sichuanensis TaxID=512349 RepID=A0ABW4A3M8_9ACTN|nr:hypothetical protein [Actinoplanes sichuanensis]BEL05537.1 hypothetical protein Q0Z83_037280 [Actinoplanes sichuanensis]